MRTRSLPTRVLDGVTEVVAGLLTAAEANRTAKFEPVVPDVPVDSASVRHFRREVFPAAGPIPWLDRPDALDEIDRAVASGRISGQGAALARAWVRDGFVILPRFFSQERLDAAWADYEAAIVAGTVKPLPDRNVLDDVLPGRALNPHFALPAFDSILRDPAMLDIVGMLIGATPLPFQSIAGHKGSEQLPHSDSIHMTSYPLGYLVANWIAFENIHPDSGPLVYYPGSHRLPYTSSADVEIGVMTGHGPPDYTPYHAKYEPAIAAAIARSGLEPAFFTPEVGDVLLWHANLIHGGSPRRAVEYSRKSLVCHYFADGCITYHDLTATPTYIEGEKIAKRRRSRFLGIDLAMRTLGAALGFGSAGATGDKKR